MCPSVSYEKGAELPGERDVISGSVPLIAERTGQEYNTRKSRKGAFWEDRHATAVESGTIYSMLVYIDLNMVRAGVGMAQMYTNEA